MLVMGGACGCSNYANVSRQRGEMALSVSDWLIEAESLLEKKSVNEAVDLLNRIGESSVHAW